MPTIVDNCVANQLFCRRANDDFEPARKAIFGGSVRIVYGGRLVQEYMRGSSAGNSQVMAIIRELDRAGRAYRVDDEAVDRHTTAVEALGVCRSNDTHIIGLAYASGARLLITADDLLSEDFTDPQIVKRPRGKVYKTRDHVHLLAAVGR